MRRRERGPLLLALIYGLLGASARADTMDFPCFQESAASDPPGIKTSSTAVPADLIDIPWDMDFESCPVNGFSPACHLGFFSNPANSPTASTQLILQADTSVKDGLETAPSFSNLRGERILSYSQYSNQTGAMRAPHSGSRYARMIIEGPNMSTTLRLDRPANGPSARFWFQQAYIGYASMFPPPVTLTGTITRGSTTMPVSIPLWGACREVGIYVPLSPSSVPSGNYFVTAPNERIVLKLCDYQQSQAVAIPQGSSSFFTLDLTLKSAPNFIYQDSGKSCLNVAGAKVKCSTFSPMAVVSIDDVSIEKLTPAMTCRSFDISPKADPGCALTGAQSPFLQLRAVRMDRPASPAYASTFAGGSLFDQPAVYQVDAICKTPSRPGLSAGYCGKSAQAATIIVRPHDDFCAFIHDARMGAVQPELPAVIEKPFSSLTVGPHDPEQGFLVYLRPNGQYSAPVQRSYSNGAVQLGGAAWEEFNEFGSQITGVMVHTHPDNCGAEIFSVGGGRRVNDSFMGGNSTNGDLEIFFHDVWAVSIVKAPTRSFMIAKPFGWAPPADSATILAAHRTRIDNIMKLQALRPRPCDQYQESFRLAQISAARALKLHLYEKATIGGKFFGPSVP